SRTNSRGRFLFAVSRKPHASAQSAAAFQRPPDPTRLRTRRSSSSRSVTGGLAPRLIWVTHMRILDKLSNLTRSKPVPGRHSHDDEFGQDLVTRIERKVLSLISDDDFKTQTFEKKEERILSQLSFLERYLAQSEETQSFLCGEFLIYDREK